MRVVAGQRDVGRVASDDLRALSQPIALHLPAERIMVRQPQRMAGRAEHQPLAADPR